MPGRPSAVTQKQLELRMQAIASNNADLAHLEGSRQKAESVVTEMKDLTVRQASLTAAKQKVSKRLAELNREGQMLMTFMDVGIRQVYGNRSEKLVEFGQQPFRNQPRIKVVGVDGKPLKSSAASVAAPEAPQAE